MRTRRLISLRETNFEPDVLLLREVRGWKRSPKWRRRRSEPDTAEIEIVMNRKRRNTVSKVGLAAQGNAASPAAKQTNAGRALEKLKSSDRAARP